MITTRYKHSVITIKLLQLLDHQYVITNELLPLFYHCWIDIIEGSPMRYHHISPIHYHQCNITNTLFVFVVRRGNEKYALPLLNWGGVIKIYLSKLLQLATPINSMCEFWLFIVYWVKEYICWDVNNLLAKQGSLFRSQNNMLVIIC